MTETKAPSEDRNAITLGGTTYEIQPFPLKVLRRIAEGVWQGQSRAPEEQLDVSIGIVLEAIRVKHPEATEDTIRGSVKEIEIAYLKVLRLSGLVTEKGAAEPGEAKAGA